MYWTQISIQILVGLVCGAGSSALVAVVFERRNKQQLEQYQHNVVEANIRMATGAVSTLTEHTKRIPEIAISVAKLEPLIDKLCDCVEKAMKK
jgi:hypothetical protein